MSLPKIMKIQEILDKVKEILIESEDTIRVVEQVQYRKMVSPFPSLKVESIILYEKNTDKSLKIVQTEGLGYKELNIEEFNNLKSSLPLIEQSKMDIISKSLNLDNRKNKLKI